MRFVVSLLALSLLTAVAPAHAQMPGFSAWKGAPSAADMALAYPPKAMAAHRGGTVVLGCEIGADGYLRDCSVVAETPRGWGFGEAALSVAGKYRMEPRMQAGRPVAGGRVRIPVVFSTPGQAVST